jgi:hypothetical protein
MPGLVICTQLQFHPVASGRARRGAHNLYWEASSQMKRLGLMLGLALVLLVTSSAALAATGLSGTYKHTVPSGPGIPPGFNTTWTINFQRAQYKPPPRTDPSRTRTLTGTYTIRQNGTPVDSGIYKISGSKITFRSQHPKGISCPSTGKYRFKLTGKKLKFTVISDSATSCYGRLVALTKGPPFTKV